MDSSFYFFFACVQRALFAIVRISFASFLYQCVFWIFWALNHATWAPKSNEPKSLTCLQNFACFVIRSDAMIWLDRSYMPSTYHINHLTLNPLRGTEILRSLHVTPVMDGSRLILLAAWPRNHCSVWVGYVTSFQCFVACWRLSYCNHWFCSPVRQAWEGFPKPPRNNPSRGSLGCGLHFAPKPQHQRYASKMFEQCELHVTRSDPAFRWQCQEADFAVELLGSRLGVGVEVYVATKLLKTARLWYLWGTSTCGGHPLVRDILNWK